MGSRCVGCVLLKTASFKPPKVHRQSGVFLSLNLSDLKRFFDAQRLYKSLKINKKKLKFGVDEVSFIP